MSYHSLKEIKWKIDTKNVWKFSWVTHEERMLFVITRHYIQLLYQVYLRTGQTIKPKRRLRGTTIILIEGKEQKPETRCKYLQVYCTTGGLRGPKFCDSTHK